MAFSMSVYFGTNLVDTHTGGSGQDWIWGGAGNDVLSGGAGDDFVYGGAGRDTIDGDAGNDVIYGGTSDATSTARQTLRGGDGNDVIYGGDHRDDIYGGIGSDVLFGSSNPNPTNPANDKIDGGGGDDFIYGSGGDDQLRGDAGNDTIRGGAGNDLVSGNGGNDVLDGGPGNDRVRPSTGDDVLTGGIGDDTFLFNQGANHYGTNYITDFGDGTDLLQIGGGLTIPHEARQAWIDSASYWDTTTTTENGDTTRTHAGATLDFAKLATELEVTGLSGIIHIQFAEPAGDLSTSDFAGWS